MTDLKNWAHFEAISRFALDCAPIGYLANIRAGLQASQISIAVARRDTPQLFGWVVGVVQMQGIADSSAATFVARNGIVGWHDIRPELDTTPACPRLQSYWAYADCGYRKATRTCAEPDRLGSCGLPQHPTRKGSLIVAAYSLALFLRDVCNDDLVGWLDQRLTDADPGPGAPDRAVALGTAVLEPLRAISGIGEKVWSMALADLLLAGDPARERWVSTGAGMVVVDRLMHAHLHRTGVLRRFGAEHPYGPRCYAPGGCADLIRGLAARVDARAYNPSFPACFPRFIQFALWRLCSTSELNVCNGNRIDDRDSCQNAICPAFTVCDRIKLGS